MYGETICRIINGLAVLNPECLSIIATTTTTKNSFQQLHVLGASYFRWSSYTGRKWPEKIVARNKKTCIKRLTIVIIIGTHYFEHINIYVVLFSKFYVNWVRCAAEPSSCLCVGKLNHIAAKPNKFEWAEQCIRC